MRHAKATNPSLPEALAVAALTFIGGTIRAWPPGRLGMVHFDEGIYALAASWAFAPTGLSAIDPLLIPYSPPGFPILVGVVYSIVGMSDLAAIVVSQIAGTLTIPAVGWVACRTFGRGAGFAAASFATFSGPAIAFSRMALTDACFLLAFVIALSQGIRFLERPGAFRAISMGLMIGVAQQFKYNGWLTGGIVVLTATFGTWIREARRSETTPAKVFGWGFLAIGVAGVIVWPWYQFVEIHGGYPALLRHQRSYLGGLHAWWPNLANQTEQAIALAPSPWLDFICIGIASLTPWLSQPPGKGTFTAKISRTRRLPIAIFLACIARIAADCPMLLGLVMAPWLLASPRPATRLSGAWWLALTILTPFYHPYARLWLPLHALNWLLLGQLITNGTNASESIRPKRSSLPGDRLRHQISLTYLAVSASISVAIVVSSHLRAHRQPDLLAPSDSLRRASRNIAEILPDNASGLRLLVRPTVLFYLAGRTRLLPMAGSNQLLSPGDRRQWALVDSTILRSEAGNGSGATGRALLARFEEHWELVEEIPTTISLPTLLDLEPGAARIRNASRSAPLWLLRPKHPTPLR